MLYIATNSYIQLSHLGEVLAVGIEISVRKYDTKGYSFYEKSHYSSKWLYMEIILTA